MVLVEDSHTTIKAERYLAWLRLETNSNREPWDKHSTLSHKTTNPPPPLPPSAFIPPPPRAPPALRPNHPAFMRLRCHH